MANNTTRILIVDDVGELRSFLTGCLKQMGYHNIHQAKDGIDALQQLKKEAKDIIFLDIEMPKQNGLETLQHIHANHPESFVIMLSCHSSLKNVKQAIAAGAGGFVVKPFSAEKIRDALTHYHQSRKSSPH